MIGFYQVDPNAAFVEIVTQEPQEYILSFGKDDIKPVVAHSTQSWPVHPLRSDLEKTTEKYGASWTITHNYYEATRVEIEVGDLELVYEMEDDGKYYRLLHIAQGDMSLSAPPAPDVEDHSRLANELIHAMPGLDEEVASPCSCLAWQKGEESVQAVIIHLNDRHHPTKGPLKADPWTRERIAQWTETLPFDLTLDPDRPKRQMRGLTAPESIYDEIHSEKYEENIKAMMASMAVSKGSFLKSVGLVSEAAEKATDALEDLSGSMKKSFEVTFKSVDPEMYEMLTGMPYPGDEKEEA